MDFVSLQNRLQQFPSSVWRTRCPHSTAARVSPPILADAVGDREDYRYQRKVTPRSIGGFGMRFAHGISKPKAHSHVQDFTHTASKKGDTKQSVRNIMVCSMDDLFPSVEHRQPAIPTLTEEPPSEVRQPPTNNRIRHVHFSPKESYDSNPSDLSFSKKLANKITQTVAIAASLHFPDHRESDRLSRRQVYDVAVNTTEIEYNDCTNNISGDLPLILQIPSRSSRCRPCNSKDPRDFSSCSSDEDLSELSKRKSQVCTARLTSDARQSTADVQPSIVPQREALDSATRLGPAPPVEYFSTQGQAQFNGHATWEIPLLTEQSGFRKDVLNHQSSDDLATPYDLRTSLAGIAGLTQRRNQPITRASKTSVRSQITNHRYENISDARSLDLDISDLPSNNPRRCFKGLDPTCFEARASSYASHLFHRNLPQKKRLKYRSALFATAPFAAQKHATGGNKTSRSSYWFDVPFPADDDDPTGRRLRVASTTPAADSNPVVNEGNRSNVGDNLTITDSGSVDALHVVEHQLSHDKSRGDSNPPRATVLDGRPHSIDSLSPSIIETVSVVYPGTLCPTFMLCPGDIMMTRNLRTEENKVGGYVTLFPDHKYFEEKGVDAGVAATSCSGYYKFTLCDMVLRFGTFDNHDDWNWVPSSFLSLFMYAPGHDRSASAASWWLVDSKPSNKLPGPDHSVDHEAVSMALNSRLQLNPRITDLVISTVPDSMLACKKRWRAQWWSPHFLPLNQDVLVRAFYDHTPPVYKRTMVAVELYSYCGDSVATWRFLGRDTFCYGTTRGPLPQLQGLKV